MKIIFGCDHNGVALKEGSINFSQGLGYLTEDCVYNPLEDYIDLTRKVISKMMISSGSFGVLICGSGFGMCMAANRHPLMRAALCRNKEDAELCRRQNDANILCLGAELTGLDVAEVCLQHFVTRPFKKERHHAHVEKLLTQGHFTHCP